MKESTFILSKGVSNIKLRIRFLMDKYLENGKHWKIYPEIMHSKFFYRCPNSYSIAYRPKYMQRYNPWIHRHDILRSNYMWQWRS